MHGGSADQRGGGVIRSPSPLSNAPARARPPRGVSPFAFAGREWPRSLSRTAWLVTPSCLERGLCVALGARGRSRRPGWLAPSARASPPRATCAVTLSPRPPWRGKAYCALVTLLGLGLARGEASEPQKGPAIDFSEEIRISYIFTEGDRSWSLVDWEGARWKRTKTAISKSACTPEKWRSDQGS